MRNPHNIKAVKMLEAARLYCTKPRLAVLNVLIKATKPIRQDQIANRLKKANIDKTTIYRNLENLVIAGIVHKAFLQQRAWHFELANACTEKQCHPHFTCKSCGMTHCMTKMRFPMAKSPYKGYVIQHQQVRLEGLCPACA